ncbi:MAG: sugar ABC transporter substrate-binding protein [Armatimonadota bacterium]|nr:sugar ABC transporter substrate-binding protein [Armatimonadota bacterium]
MERLTRREMLRVAAGGITAWLLGADRWAWAGPAADPYAAARIDWRQLAGERIHILVTPAHYFTKFRAITPEFTRRTGIEVTFEVIPPREMREKAVLDLSARTGNYASHTADPMFLPLYAVNNWVEPLDLFLNDHRLTDRAWFDLDDIVPLWRRHNTVRGRLWGMPVEGEVTIHIYRKDVYEQLGIRPPDTLDELREAARRAHSPARNLFGLALRGFRGAGQNMYIWPSLFRAYGGQWFDHAGRPTVNSEAGVRALEYYVGVLRDFAPRGVENWNWPEIMEAFAAGTLVQYIDANSTASVIENPSASRVGGRIGYQRWPKGPTGKRVTSIWNWAMPVNAALPARKKQATWLYIQWLASRPTQLHSATFREAPDAVVRTGVNRMSLWRDPGYRRVIAFTPDYADVVLTSLGEDTDVDWRPRIPEWPEIGEVMAIAIQEALVGRKTPKQALDDANAGLRRVLRR